MFISTLQKELNFTAGKVNFYSDFDGTYCPASHSSLRKPNANQYMHGYSNKMKNFFDLTNGDLQFHITTGRTFGEYEAVSRLLKKRGFNLPLPESFIAKNGSDEYLRQCSDKEFYEKDIFPYSYNKSNSKKAEIIKDLTSWDGAEIKSFVQKAAKKYQINLIEADSENSPGYYGKNSLFSEGKINVNAWDELPLKIGSRNDGNLKLHFIFPPNYKYQSKKLLPYDDFMNEIVTFLKEKNTKFEIKWHNLDKYNSCSIVPKLGNKRLSKIFDTKNALADAIKNNDIVVAAGNESNDFDMLNPIEYLDKDYIETCKKDSSNKEFYIKSSKEKVKDLYKIFKEEHSNYIDSLREELNKNGFIKKIKELPLYTIIIGNDNEDLKLLYKTFGGLDKVLCVNHDSLDEGVKRAVRIHAEKNKKYRNSMSKKFKKLILNTKDKSSKIWLLLLLTSVAALSGAYYLINKKTDKKS